MDKNRNTGIDLLRILLALAVVTIHFNATATGHVSSSVNRLPMKFLVYGMDSIVLPAVNIYVIISGYFSYLSMRSYKHVVGSLAKLWFCLMFFSVGGACVVSLVSPGSIATADFIKRFFPIMTCEWWYMTVYFATMLISPFLNKAVKQFSKSDSILFLAAMILVCSIVPFFTKNQEVLGVNLGYSLIWFIVLYYTGAILCKYYSNIKSKHWAKFFVGLALCQIAMGFIASHFKMLNGFGFSSYNSILLYAQAIVCFLWFKNINIKNNHIKAIIGFLSGLSLATYIFHCQSDIGKMIWENLNPSQYADSIKLVPVFVITIFSIFIISVLVELLRRKLVSIGGIEKKIINKIINNVEIMWGRIYGKF